ncbi:MAG: hypothetical protein U5K81_14255 [Trueperaceae bacterium]|nr:hypothetical protein [Trueperaceae bacterium]
MIVRPKTVRSTQGGHGSSEVARRLVLGVLALACTAWVLAFSPPLGSEVLITDTSGSRFVGYGTLSESGLNLELSEELAEFRVVVVTPEGASQPYRGRWNGQSLTLTDAGGSEVDVAAALADEGRILSLSWPDGRRQVVLPDAMPSQASDGGAADAAPEGAPDDDAPGRSADAPGDRPGDGAGDGSPRQDDDRRPPQADPEDEGGDEDGAGPARPDLPDEVPDDVPDEAPDVPGSDAPQDGGDDEPAQDEQDDQDVPDEQNDGDGGVDVGVDADVDVGGEDDDEDEGDEDASGEDADQDDEDEDDASGSVDLDLP